MCGGELVCGMSHPLVSIAFTIWPNTADLQKAAKNSPACQHSPGAGSHTTGPGGWGRWLGGGGVGSTGMQGSAPPEAPRHFIYPSLVPNLVTDLVSHYSMDTNDPCCWCPYSIGSASVGG